MYLADIWVIANTVTEAGARFGPAPVVLLHRTEHSSLAEAQLSIQENYRDAVEQFMEYSEDWGGSIRHGVYSKEVTCT